MWQRTSSMDPADLQKRFSNQDAISMLDNILDEPTEEDEEKLEVIRGMLDRLPPREADFIELYFFHKMRQTEIANLYNVSQPTVCYRLQRATTRLRFILSLPEFDLRKMEEDLKKVFKDVLDVKILMYMWRTDCQSEVARHLEVSQGLVRHRFLKSIEALWDYPALEAYARAFKQISMNLNLLREVNRPQQEIDHLVIE